MHLGHLHLCMFIQYFQQFFLMIFYGHCPSQSKTTNSTINVLKVSLSTQKITKDVEIPHWKELTLFYSFRNQNIFSNWFFRFDWQFLGHMLDYGELPRNIFQPNKSKSTLCVMLKMVDDLPVCLGIKDSSLKDSLLYFIDS